PEGEKGELVFTSLTKEAMPVVRYRTRDLTRLLPPTARSMRRIEKITGRSDDMIKIRGGKRGRRARRGGAAAPDQVADRRELRGARRRAGRHRALGRQGEARRGQ